MRGKPAMVFIDAQNLFHGSKAYSSDCEDEFSVDLVSLTDELSKDRDLIRSYYFDSFEPGNREDKEPFYTFLEMNGFRVDANPLRERDGGYVEKGADIGLATELLAQGLGDSYEVAVVVTGDDDFSRAIKHVQNRGKIVEVASFESNFSSNLKRVADDFVSLDGIASEIERS